MRASTTAWRGAAAVAAAMCLAGTMHTAEAKDWGPDALKEKNVSNGSWYTRCCAEVASDTSSCPNTTFTEPIYPRMCEENGEGVFLPFSSCEKPPRRPFVVRAQRFGAGKPRRLPGGFPAPLLAWPAGARRCRPSPATGSHRPWGVARTPVRAAAKLTKKAWVRLFFSLGIPLSQLNGRSTRRAVPSTTPSCSSTSLPALPSW